MNQITITDCISRGGFIVVVAAPAGITFSDCVAMERRPEVTLRTK